MLSWYFISTRKDLNWHGRREKGERHSSSHTTVIIPSDCKLGILHLILMEASRKRHLKSPCALTKGTHADLIQHKGITHLWGSQLFQSCLLKPEHKSTFKISTTKFVISKDRVHKEVYQKRHVYRRSLPKVHINLSLKLHKGFTERSFVKNRKHFKTIVSKPISIRKYLSSFQQKS